MMKKVSDLRQKLHQYIDEAGEKELKVLYSMVEEEMTEYNRWSNKDFVEEMNRRASEFESGKVKGNSWEEVKRKVIE
jgi:hypothetical protein